MKKLWTILLAVLLVTGLTFTGCGEAPPPPDVPTLVWSLAAWFAGDYEGETYVGDFKYDKTKTAKENIDMSPLTGGGAITGSEVTISESGKYIGIPGGRGQNYDQLNLKLGGEYSLNLKETDGPVWVRFAGRVTGTSDDELFARLQQHVSPYADFETEDVLGGLFDFVGKIPAGTSQVNLGISDEDDAYKGAYRITALEVWIGAEPGEIEVE